MSNGAVTRMEFDRLYAQVNGNGQPGMKQTVDAVATDVAEIKAVQAERQRVDSRRWVIMTVILSFLGVILAVLTAIQANHAVHSGELSWPAFPQKSLHNSGDPVVAWRQKQPELSDIPHLGR